MSHVPAMRGASLRAPPAAVRPGPADAMAARMDRLPVTRLHLAATALCALGFSFDLMEIALGNVLSAVFSLPPHGASSTALAWLLASVYIGAIFGAPLLGWCADRWGRRNTLVAVLAWVALTSLAAAFSPGLLWLGLARGMAGLALGAYPPLMFAYLTDILPPSRRGLLIFLTVAAGALGPPAGIFFVRALSPDGWAGIEAWRWAFVAGALGGAGVALALRRLPESPRWLAVQGRAAAAAEGYAAFARSPGVLAAAAGAEAPLPPAGGSALRPSLLPVGLLYFLSPWSTVAFPLLIGAVLVDKGFRLADTLLFVGVSTFGLVFGSALSAAFVDKLQRRVALGSCALALVACALVFALSQTPFWLMASATAFTLCAALYVPTLTLYGAEVFPTQTRARWSALAWACNRLGAALAPFVLLPLLRHVGAFEMSLVIAAVLLASLLVLWFCPRGYAGKPVR